MQYINLTPHAVTILDEDGVAAEYPASGQVARVETTEGHVDTYGHVRVSYGAISSLPDGVPTNADLEGTTYIVSLVTLLAAHAARNPWRHTLVAPYSEVRDDSGRIIGCRSLQTLS